MNEFRFCILFFFFSLFFFWSTQTRIPFPRKITMGHLKAGTCLQAPGKNFGLSLFWLEHNEFSGIRGHLHWAFLPIPSMSYIYPRVQVVWVAPLQFWEQFPVQKGGNNETIVFCCLLWLTFSVNLLIDHVLDTSPFWRRTCCSKAKLSCSGARLCY